jgi:hypothetical protein
MESAPAHRIKTGRTDVARRPGASRDPRRQRGRAGRRSPAPTARASVLRELHTTRACDGLIGDFRFDRYGDITPARFHYPAGDRLRRARDRVPRLEVRSRNA